MRKILAIAIALFLLAIPGYAAYCKSNSHNRIALGTSYHRHYHGHVEVAALGSHSAGPRPGKWCGWWMRTQFGGGEQYNVARNWAHRGVNAGGPQVGAVVVWPHHVGMITGRTASGQWVVKSGNDGHAVRERPRSVSKAIAFRML